MVNSNSNSLYFAMSFNEAYLLPALVTIKSLSHRLSKNIRPVLLLLSNDLSPDSIDLIGSCVETQVFETDFSQIGDFCNCHRFPVEAAAPILLASVLPRNLNRVIFLDADLLILEDIEPLLQIDLEGHAIGAVKDCTIPTLGSPRGVKDVGALGLDPNEPYFNAGVMVFDLKTWRKDRPLSGIYKYLKKTEGRADFFHQEALNAVLGSHWKNLDPRWNIAVGPQSQQFGSIEHQHQLAPAILHFSGRIKPWRTNVSSPYFQEYQSYVQLILKSYPSIAQAHEKTTKDMLLSLYERYLRQFLYPLEHLLWKHRII